MQGLFMKDLMEGFFFWKKLYDPTTVKALNSALLSSAQALISAQKLGDQLFLCSKSPQ